MAGADRDLETQARRARMVAAAVELATIGGYDAVQMRDVAARADVALGTLYRHFPSKDHLLLAALGEQAKALEARLTEQPPSGEDPATRTAEVLRRANRALARRPALTAALVTAMGSTEPDAAAAKDAVQATLRAMITAAIGDAPVPDLDGVVRTLGYVWLSVLSGWVSGTLDVTQLVDDLDTAARLLLGARVSEGAAATPHR